LDKPFVDQLIIIKKTYREFMVNVYCDLSVWKDFAVN